VKNKSPKIGMNEDPTKHKGGGTLEVIKPSVAACPRPG